MFPTITDVSRNTIILKELETAGIQQVPGTLLGYQGKGNDNGSLLDKVFVMYERKKDFYIFTAENVLPFMIADITRIENVSCVKKDSKIIRGIITKPYSLKIVASIFSKEFSTQYKA